MLLPINKEMKRLLILALHTYQTEIEKKLELQHSKLKMALYEEELHLIQEALIRINGKPAESRYLG
jgi:hypothetical protein